MLNLILDASLFSALLFFAISLEGCPPTVALPQGYSDFMSVVSRYVVVALAAFPWITFAKFRAGERALQRVGTKLLVSTGVCSGRTYLSEILISVCLSLLLLGSFAARRGAHRLLRRTAKLTPSNSGSESENYVKGQALP